MSKNIIEGSVVIGTAVIVTGLVIGGLYMESNKYSSDSKSEAKKIVLSDTHRITDEIRTSYNSYEFSGQGNDYYAFDVYVSAANIVENGVFEGYLVFRVANRESRGGFRLTVFRPDKFRIKTNKGTVTFNPRDWNGSYRDRWAAVSLSESNAKMLASGTTGFEAYCDGFWFKLSNGFSNFNGVFDNLK